MAASKIPVSILAVDDELGLLQALKLALEIEGFHVQTAPDGVAAINFVQSLPFDLVQIGRAHV
jgi:DNA-binding response OmpR family regulator